MTERASSGTPDAPCGPAIEQGGEIRMDSTLGLYLHIPFCVRKCRYCDFLSFPAPDSTRNRYLEALRSEIRTAALLYGARPVDTVFIGGGTPSILRASELRGLLDAASCGGGNEAGGFSLLPDAEVTAEMNPGAAWTEEEIRMLAGSPAGGRTGASTESHEDRGRIYVNRWSVGLQSVHDEELAVLGRIHTFRDFEKTYADLRQAGGSNINVDLMYGIPGQTLAGWEETLRTVTGMGPEHISAYSLIVEEGTPFHAEYEAGKLDLPDEDTEREMARSAVQILAEAGYRQYEISNFAKPGYESRHNTRYWRRSDYLGLGLGAASLIDSVRWSNTRDPDEYLRAFGVQGRADAADRSGEKALLKIRREEKLLTAEEQMEEFLFLGLRMNDGVSLRAFEEQFGKTVFDEYGEVLDRYMSLGLLQLIKDGGNLAFTPAGADVSNLVLSEFLHD